MNRVLALVAAAVVACCAAAPARAAVLDGSFAPSGGPRALALGPDGNVWFALAAGGTNKEFGRIAPDGTITEYDMPGGQTVEGVVAGPNASGGPADRVWVAFDGGVAKIDPANPGAPIVYPVNTLGAARDIAPDRDGNLWVVDGLDGLVKVAPNGVKLADVPVNGSGGRKIVLGNDGRMLWTDFSGQAVWATQTSAPYTTSAVAPNLGDGPQALATRPGGPVVFGLPGNRIGRFLLGGAPVFTTDTGGDAGFGVTYADDLGFWVTRFARDGLGRLSEDGSYTTPIAFPAGSGPRNIARGAGGTLWVSLEGTNRIARVSKVDFPVDAGQGGVQGQPARDTVRPRLTALRLDAKRRRLGVTLSEAATLRIAIDRRATGRRKGKRCLAPRKARRGKRCVRHVRTRFLRKPVAAGRRRVSLGGRLRPGRYRVSVVAVDAAGNRSAVARKALVVKKAKRKRR